MVIGIHLYGPALAADEITTISQLDRAKTHIFFDSPCPELERRLTAMGFEVYPAEGEDKEFVKPECHLPKQMTCVGAAGTVYACGLVLGDENYRFGNFFERKLMDVVKDSSLPYVVPEGLPKSHHRCNGCPPLVLHRIRQKAP